MHRKRIIFTGFGLLLTGAMLLSSCAFFKKTVSQLSDLENSISDPDPSVLYDQEENPVVSDPDSASDLKQTPAVTTKDSAAASTHTHENTATPTLVGAWSVDRITDQDGNTVDAQTLQNQGGSLGGVLAKVIKKGTSLTFTEDGKLKCSVLSVRYSIDSASALTLSGGVLPQSYTLSFSVSQNSAQLHVGGYHIGLTRNA